MDYQNPETKTNNQGQILVPDFTERLRVYNLEPEELTLRLDIVGRALLDLSADKKDDALVLTEEEAEKLVEIGFVHDEDFELIQQDPRIQKAERKLKESRGTTAFENSREISRLTEWQVVLEGLNRVVIAKNISAA